jgi:hypothetical protein
MEYADNDRGCQSPGPRYCDIALSADELKELRRIAGRAVTRISNDDKATVSTEELAKAFPDRFNSHSWDTFCAVATDALLLQMRKLTKERKRGRSRRARTMANWAGVAPAIQNHEIAIEALRAFRKR